MHVSGFGGGRVIAVACVCVCVCVCALRHSYIVADAHSLLQPSTAAPSARQSWRYAFLGQQN
jgi:hypothetical protein